YALQSSDCTTRHAEADSRNCRKDGGKCGRFGYIWQPIRRQAAAGSAGQAATTPEWKVHCRDRDHANAVGGREIDDDGGAGTGDEAYREASSGRAAPAFTGTDFWH